MAVNQIKCFAQYSCPQTILFCNLFNELQANNIEKSITLWIPMLISQQSPETPYKFYSWQQFIGVDDYMKTIIICHIIVLNFHLI